MTVAGKIVANVHDYFRVIYPGVVNGMTGHGLQSWSRFGGSGPWGLGA